MSTFKKVIHDLATLGCFGIFLFAMYASATAPTEVSQAGITALLIFWAVLAGICTIVLLVRREGNGFFKRLANKMIVWA